VTPDRLALTALPGIPLVKPGDDLAAHIIAALERAGERLQPGDVLVVAQKVVSKAEGRFFALDEIEPSAKAAALAETVDKDARLVELILSESRRVVRHRPGVLIVEHRLGYVLANAGIDASNIEPEGGQQRILLLPVDPDASCRRLRDALRARTEVAAAVIVNDSVGRAWRNGTVAIALGAAGLSSLLDLRGALDLFGRPLRVSQVGLADQLAAAASLVQGEAAEGTPVVLIRGFAPEQADAGAAGLIRKPEEDLFR
jgi:coenzyme F420-0:L-glutamate ligase/coenzyme F420-1:gamma-L-glutamate ligase